MLPDGSATIFRNLLDRGFLGVTFFFVLSGYILSLNYLDKFQRGTADLKSFFVARFARIYPLYIVSVVMCVPYVFTNPSLSSYGHHITELRANPLSAALMYLLGAESHWSNKVGRLTVLPSWSISTEFFFYLLFPVFAWVVGRLSRYQARVGLIIVALWALGVALMFHYASLATVLFFLPKEKVQIINDFFFQKMVSGIHTNWPLFATGMLAFRGFEGALSATTKKWLPWMLVFFWIANPAWYVLQPRHMLEDMFFVTKFFDALPLCVVTILWLHKGTGVFHSWLGNKTLVFLGEISFAVYLVHSPVRLAGRFLLAKPLGIPEASPIFYVPLWIITLLLSWAAWRYVEVPARSAILGAWKRRQTRQQTTTV